MLESLAIAPAFEGQLSSKNDDDAHGVSGQLLRLINPAQLLGAVVEQLQANHHWRENNDRLAGRAIPAPRQAVHETIAKGRPRSGPVSEQQLAEIAQTYLTLWNLGSRRPLRELAGRFGITETQARDRVHKARTSGYLTPGSKGARRPTRAPPQRLEPANPNRPSRSNDSPRHRSGKRRDQSRQVPRDRPHPRDDRIRPGRLPHDRW